jgi:hypothetical protein
MALRAQVASQNELDTFGAAGGRLLTSATLADCFPFHGSLNWQRGLAPLACLTELRVLPATATSQTQARVLNIHMPAVHVGAKACATSI